MEEIPDEEIERLIVRMVFQDYFFPSPIRELLGQKFDEYKLWEIFYPPCTWIVSYRDENQSPNGKKTDNRIINVSSFCYCLCREKLDSISNPELRKKIKQLLFAIGQAIFLDVENHILDHFPEALNLIEKGLKQGAKRIGLDDSVIGLGKFDVSNSGSGTTRYFVWNTEKSTPLSLDFLARELNVHIGIDIPSFKAVFTTKGKCPKCRLTLLDKHTKHILVGIINELYQNHFINVFGEAGHMAAVNDYFCDSNGNQLFATPRKAVNNLKINSRPNQERNRIINLIIRNLKMFNQK